MKRRNFLINSSIFGLSVCIQAKEKTPFEKEFFKVKATIMAVQVHMFPKGSKLPSAVSVNAIQFLFETLAHKSFDRDIKAYVLEGAEELESREKGGFVSLNNVEKERALRDYEKTNYGRSWLSRIMTLTMEGMFSDPIYGANIKERGWESVASYGGFPRPTTKYLES